MYHTCNASAELFISIGAWMHSVVIIRLSLISAIISKRFLLLHGDGEKSIDRIARDSINLYGEPIDYFICGHLHRENDMPAGTTDSGNSVIVRVPSLCGMDRYAQSKGFGAKAGAIAMVIEKDYGRRCVYPIRLQ